MRHLQRHRRRAGSSEVNRETWLWLAIRELSKLLAEAGAVVPEKIAASTGWPSAGGLAMRRKVNGECWSQKSGNGITQIFVNPTLGDSVEVLSVMTHELIHASDDCESGHRGYFVRVAKAVGLVRPWTATTAGTDLKCKLIEIIGIIGPYPHVKMSPVVIKKQSTRMIKLVCAVGPTDGFPNPYSVRTTRMWIDGLGTPKCPCHDISMEEEDNDG